MFVAKLKSFKSLVILAIVTNIAIFVTAGGVLAQEPADWPPRVPHYSQGSGVSLSSINPATATDLALAMEVPGSDLLAADLMGSDAFGVGVSDAPLGSWFPTEGSTFAILSTGLAADATLPDDSGSHSGYLVHLGINSPIV